MPPSRRSKKRKKKARRGGRTLRLLVRLGMVPLVAFLGLAVGYLNAAFLRSRPPGGGGAADQTANAAAGGWAVDTVAGGRYGTLGYLDGPAEHARFNGPVGVAVDRAGTVFVSDALNFAVRYVTPAGAVVTVAGGAAGYADGWYDQARFALPEGLAVDAAGNILVADRLAHCIRQISRTTGIATVAGAFELDDGFLPVGGYEDGRGTGARFLEPRAVAMGAGGEILVADAGNDCVRRILPDGSVQTVAGSPRLPGLGGTLPLVEIPAGLQAPAALAAEPGGTIYVAEAERGRVLRLGNGASAVVATGLLRPSGIAVGHDGAVYVAETGRNRICRLGPAGQLEVVAGTEEAGSSDGPSSLARFREPRGLAADEQGNLYVADTGNHRIRRLARTL